VRRENSEVHAIAHPCRSQRIGMTEPNLERCHSGAVLIGHGGMVRNRMSTPLQQTRRTLAFASRATVVALVIFSTALLFAAAIFNQSRQRGNGQIAEGALIDRIVVEKAARRLSVFRKGRKLKSYHVALGEQPIGAKRQEGDMKTPEGVYKIDYRNRHSDYHLALHISYPDADDVARAAARGVSAGSDIMIHGLPNGHGGTDSFHSQKDWTAGCIAVTDAEIEELWRITPDQTPVEIRP
jgi:murein L,D-transpeptidase YafK